MEIIWFNLSAYAQLHIQFPCQVSCIWIHLVMRKIPIMWDTNTSIFYMLLRNSFLAFSRLEVSFTFFSNRMSNHLLQQIFGIMKYSIYCSIHWHNVYCYSSYHTDSYRAQWCELFQGTKKCACEKQGRDFSWRAYIVFH